MSDTIASFNEFISTPESENGYEKFRKYLYNPGEYYKHCDSEITSIGILMSPTRRVIETVLAGEIIKNMAKVPEHSELIETILTSLTTEVGRIMDENIGYIDENIINLFRVYSSKNIDLHKIQTIFKEIKPASNQYSQFLDALMQFRDDFKKMKMKDIYGNVDHLLSLLVLTQIYSWMGGRGQASKITKKVKSTYGTHVRYKYRGRSTGSYANSAVFERGISFTAKNIFGTELEGNMHYTGATQNNPGYCFHKNSKENQGIFFKKNKFGICNKIINRKKEWLDVANNRNQSYVNSISGICLFFSQVMDFIGSKNLLSSTQKSNVKKIQAYMAAIIVYYPGGHTFYECIKGFKEGSKILNEKHLRWQDFCFENEFIKNEVINKTLEKLRNLT